MTLIRWHESGAERSERDRLRNSPQTERNARPTGPGAKSYNFEKNDSRFAGETVQEDEGGQFIEHTTPSGVVVRTRVETRE